MLAFGALLAAAPANAADPVVAAAGDIACDPQGIYFNGGAGDATHCHQQHTSDLLLTKTLAAVLPLGDVQYEEGTLAQFQGSYDPSWGRLKSISRPVIGNHEYFNGSGDPVGSGYFDYFNGVGNPTGPAGDRDKGYYSFDVGEWHLVALNSVCAQVGGCAAGSAQERWLRADLEAHPNSCTLAYWHHPFFNSGGEGSYTGTRDLWQALYESGAELVLNGHAHSYERFARQNPEGGADSTHGIREFVVGTGGKSLGGFGTPHPNSQVRDSQAFGFLELTLHPSSYDWTYRHDSGNVVDSGSTTCHAPPPGGPPHAETGRATSVGSTSARLNAAVNPHGRPTTYRFEYGPTTSYGSATAPEAVSPVNSSHRQVGAQLSGPPGATYHYRVVAESAAGTATGADRTVTLAASADPYAATVAATPGLRSYWRLGETSGAFSWDEHGLELGTYRGGPSLGQPGALSRESNPATAFDGVDDELSATGPVISTSGTLEGWFRWSSGKAVLRDDSWAEGWVLAYENTSGNLGYRVGGRAFSTGRDVDTLARDGAWHHIAVTKDSSSAAIYLDGALQHPDTGATNDLASGPWHVMRNGQHSEYAQGQADEIAIYDVALPAATIKQHYDAAQPDRTPPETTIDSGTTGLTNGTSASFTFSSSEAGSTFRCRLDGPGPSIGSEASCSSPKSYTGLGNGSYTFRVHATDPSGNADASPATGSFTVDTAAPQTTIDSGPSGTTTATDASFSFSSSESGSSFQCRLGSGAWSPCSSPKGYGGLAPGSYTFEVAATDAAGNLDVTPASRSFTIAPASSPGDTSPPDTAITAGPDGLETQNDVSFSLSSTEPGSGYRCRLDGPGPALGDEASCGSPRSYSDLADGGYTFRVYAVDPAGNGDPTPATRSFTIDTTAPETTIDSGPSGTTTSPDATFSFSAAEPGSAFQCRLDMGAWAACTSPAAYTGLPAGAHVFEVRATDPAGNTDTTPASRTFTVQPPAAPAVDASPPDTTIDSGPSGAGTSTEASFSFSSSEPGSDFRCRLDGSDWGACSSPAGYSALGYGEHVFEVRATDSAGNADPSPASRTWSVERESAPAPGEPDQEGGPSPVRRSYRPRGYDIRSGRVYRGRGALRRLHRDESRRLELAGRRKRPGVYASDVVIRTSVRAAVRASLARLAVRYNGGATGGTITLSVYNHRTRRWRTIHGPSRARRSDRDVRWSTSKRPRDYVSRGGAILLRVRGTAQRAFRLRSDLVRFTIDY